VGDEAAELRHDLVERLRDHGHLSDDRVADAFATVPREAFLPEHAARLGLAAVYRDEAIVTRRDPVSRMPTSSSSQPAIMARMLEMLDLRDGQRVLEVGAGTGYNAALLSRLVGPKGNVTSVELDREVAARAREALLATRSAASVVVGDGRAGAPDGGLVDRIVVTASSEAVPRPWYDQLVPGGVLVLPLRLSRVLFSVQVVVALRKVSSGFDTVAASSGAFMAMRGPSATGDARPAQAVVAEHADARHDRPVLRLTGPALAGLDAAGRQRLLVTALGFSRRRQVDLDGASSWALASYAALDLPEERQCELVGGFPWMGPRELSLGVVDAADGSLALLIGDSTSARMAAFGGTNAEQALLGVLSRWRARGRPGTDEVTLRVRYGSQRPQAWRTLRRGDHWVAVDWAGRGTP
jgi:protein-L-isoaspartate(D-aspartate) O-methyltransferase